LLLGGCLCAPLKALDQPDASDCRSYLANGRDGINSLYYPVEIIVTGCAYFIYWVYYLGGNRLKSYYCERDNAKLPKIVSFLRRLVSVGLGCTAQPETSNEERGRAAALQDGWETAWGGALQPRCGCPTRSAAAAQVVPLGVSAGELFRSDLQPVEITQHGHCDLVLLE
jgi:hypothetical protein